MKKVIKLSTVSLRVRKAYNDGKKFIDMDNRYRFTLNIDTSDGLIWADLFTGPGEYKIYKSLTVIQLWEESFSEVEHEIKEGYIKKAVELLKTAGWEVVE